LTYLFISTKLHEHDAVASQEFGMRGGADLRENNLGVTSQNQQKDAKTMMMLDYDAIRETTDFEAKI